MSQRSQIRRGKNGGRSAVDKEKIVRINFLAAKSKTEGLSEVEKEEQKLLRDEYRAYMRNGYMAEFANTFIVDENGNKRRLLKK